MWCIYIYNGLLLLLSRLHVCLYMTLWTAACQAPLSMGFSRQDSWSGLPCPPHSVLLLSHKTVICNNMDGLREYYA